ncbi:DUF4038 domain-containing protein [Ruania halotolerans]|uniref:apiosidase-like domain-containing protein n=1 Tax=Ruania halotolerans TaxID=2897773 RepID=UPI001E3FFB9C|nr:DUF4038 domain-containing protein [Ruania halotolerans]UFU06298.1 DUF4038 domain-containing protein [Ruania halotolerans]
MAQREAHVHEPYEIELTGPQSPIRADQVPFQAEFTHTSGRAMTLLGFWDGERRYLVRIAPPLAGTWTWRTSSDAAELDGHSGEFTAEPAEPAESAEFTDSPAHGVVRVNARFHFAHEDGTPFRPVGATVYNWIHQDEPLRTQTMASLSEAGLNKLRFMVFPQAGGYVEHFPELMPFERTDDGWDVGRPKVEFFRRLDSLVADLGNRGIEADVLIFDAYDRGVFGLNELTEEQDAAYLRYLVARLGAYPNVWWSLCNEFDQMTDRPTERWTRAGELLAKIDAHDHLRSIHNWVELYDYNQRWVTHASIQNGYATEALGRASLYRDVYRKPIVLDEIKYEGDTERWGRLSAPELVDRFWITTASGCYASHGESFVTESGSLHIVEGGRLRGESPARLGFLRQVLDGLQIPGLDPIDKWDDPASVVGKAREQYLIYLGRDAPAEWTFRLPQGHDGDRLKVGDAFEVQIIDTWNMTITTAPDEYVLTEVQRNDAYAHNNAPVALPEGEAIALLITRVPSAS